VLTFIGWRALQRSRSSLALAVQLRPVFAVVRSYGGTGGSPSSRRTLMTATVGRTVASSASTARKSGFRRAGWSGNTDLG